MYHNTSHHDKNINTAVTLTSLMDSSSRTISSPMQATRRCQTSIQRHFRPHSCRVKDGHQGNIGIVQILYSGYENRIRKRIEPNEYRRIDEQNSIILSNFSHTLINIFTYHIGPFSVFPKISDLIHQCILDGQCCIVRMRNIFGQPAIGNDFDTERQQSSLSIAQ